MAPLDGIRVIDFTAAMAGPTCSMLLADFGADVIKIEPPGGEFGRKWGANRHGELGDYSGLFLALNRNKRSATLNLKDPTDVQMAHDLIASADVVLENYSPGVADKLGIGYETARELNPTVVYCSISGFGQNGPMRNRPGLDLLLQAYCGHLSVTGEEDRPSVRIGHSAIDLLSGTNAAFGIMLALRERDRTGRGQSLDTSLYESAVELMSHYIGAYTGSGDLPGKSGQFFAFSSPYGMFQARDREFFMGAADDRMFRSLCTAIGREDLAEQPEYASNALRIRNRDALHAELIPIFAQRDAEEWVDLCVEHRIPTSLIHNVAEVVEQEQGAARDMFVETGIDGIRVAGLPIKLHGTPGAIRWHAPHAGQHNEELRAELAAGDTHTAGSASS
jgi:crotonobetainyl-CoA:carnitine CoA-transferase CaiB-like acyl-CoA transferase